MKSIELQQVVLHLPKQELAQLVHLLLESLDQPSESNIQQSWLHEAERRALQIDHGEVQLVTATELDHQVQVLFK